jgi:hypothetical protein
VPEVGPLESTSCSTSHCCWMCTDETTLLDDHESAEWRDSFRNSCFHLALQMARIVSPTEMFYSQRYLLSVGHKRYLQCRKGLGLWSRQICDSCVCHQIDTVLEGRREEHFLKSSMYYIKA